MDIEVNYRNKRRYKTARYPLHQCHVPGGQVYPLRLLLMEQPIIITS